LFSSSFHSAGTRTLPLAHLANLALPLGLPILTGPLSASSAPLEDPLSVLPIALIAPLEVVVPSLLPWQMMPPGLLQLVSLLVTPTLLSSTPAPLPLLSSPLPWTRLAPWRSVPWLTPQKLMD